MERGDQFTTLNGLRTWFSVRGSGPVCLFPTPGWGASSDLYFETLQPLERWFTVVYLDTRGCGRSQRGLPESAYALEGFLSDLDELRKHLGQDRVWIMGHSLGGWLAQMFAVSYPNSCRGLVLLSSTAVIDEQASIETEQRARRRSHEAWFPAAFAALQSEADIATDAEFKSHLAAILPFYFHDLSKYRPGDFDRSTYTIEAYQLITRNTEDLARGALDGLSALDLPAVIVTGDDDFICSSRHAMRIHFQLAGSKLVVVEQAGHFPWLEQPDSFYRGMQGALKALGVVEELPV